EDGVGRSVIGGNPLGKSRHHRSPHQLAQAKNLRHAKQTRPTNQAQAAGRLRRLRSHCFEDVSGKAVAMTGSERVRGLEAMCNAYRVPETSIVTRSRRDWQRNRTEVATRRNATAVFKVCTLKAGSSIS